MKIILTLLALLALVISGRSLTLEWDANTETNLAGYKIYAGKLSRQYVAIGTNFGGTNTVFVITNTLTGTNFFAVTAFDTDGLESEYSDEVWTVIKPQPPSGLRFAASITVQAAPAITGPWQNVTQLSGDASSQKFYRFAIAPPEQPVAPTQLLRFDGSRKGKLTPSAPRSVGLPFPG